MHRIFKVRVDNSNSEPRNAMYVRYANTKNKTASCNSYKNTVMMPIVIPSLVSSKVSLKLKHAWAKNTTIPNDIRVIVQSNSANTAKYLILLKIVPLALKLLKL